MQNTAPSIFDILRTQPIDDSHPGTILRDFQTLLEFVGTGGIETGGKNFRLPMSALSELDGRMTNPLRPRLTRPQQVSYPHLNGLYLLLRATGLVVSSGEGATGRLSVSPDRLAEWGDLNPEERYFTLFQSMLTADWGLIDATDGSRNGVWQTASWMLGAGDGMCAAKKSGGMPASDRFPGWTYQTAGALLELFGVLEIGREAPRSGENWRINGIRTPPFGAAFLARLYEPSVFHQVIRATCNTSTENTAWLAGLYRDYFPNCVNTLGRDEGDFVDGVWQFKVSLGDAWRRIVIPAELSTEELIGAILAGFKFDDDHLYKLQVRDRSGRTIEIGHPNIRDVEHYTDEFAIGRLPLNPRQSMKFLYDFGDNWHFKVTLEKILPIDMSLDKPKIIARHGKAPRQYDDDDWL